MSRARPCCAKRWRRHRRHHHCRTYHALCCPVNRITVQLFSSILHDHSFIKIRLEGHTEWIVDKSTQMSQVLVHSLEQPASETPVFKKKKKLLSACFCVLLCYFCKSYAFNWSFSSSQVLFIRLLSPWKKKAFCCWWSVFLKGQNKTLNKTLAFSLTSKNNFFP